MRNSLDKIVKDMTFKKVKVVDQTIKDYIEASVISLTAQGKDICDYAFISVDNPMQVTATGVRVTQQYRIIPIDQLSNLPVYPEDSE